MENEKSVSSDHLPVEALTTANGNKTYTCYMLFSRSQTDAHLIGLTHLRVFISLFDVKCFSLNIASVITINACIYRCEFISAVFHTTFHSCHWLLSHIRIHKAAFTHAKVNDPIAKTTSSF